MSNVNLNEKMKLVWEEPTKSGGMHCIKSGPYLITKQDGRYQASKQKRWENLGPAGSLEEAKKLCEESEE